MSMHKLTILVDAKTPEEVHQVASSLTEEGVKLDSILEEIGVVVTKEMDPNEAERLRKIPGVSSVQVEETSYRPLS